MVDCLKCKNHRWDDNKLMMVCDKYSSVLEVDRNSDILYPCSECIRSGFYFKTYTPERLSDEELEAVTHQKVSEVICVKCARRWIAVRPVATKLKDLECSKCGAGFVIETGEEIND